MHDPVEQAAAAWALRHPLNAAEKAELEVWLASDRRHSGALLRAMAGLSVIDQALAPQTSPTPAIRVDAPMANAPSRRWLLTGMGAAAAAAVVGLVGRPWLFGERVTTTRGEIRRLPLADGSVATIDTSSELRVAMVSDSRRIALDKGQAWFQVAKDRKRPFIVDAGIAQARAVGTAFSVRRTDEGVQIAVTEGSVAVWASDASGTMMILDAGQFANFRPGETAPATGTAPAAIERALAWRAGEIALENETLGSAVEQFNRYNRQQLVIVDKSLAGERLVGLFQIDSPGVFAATLASSLDIAVTTTPAEIRLARKKIPQP
jgi:transmembrane sensor